MISQRPFKPQIVIEVCVGVTMLPKHPPADACDFEEGSCGWQQGTTDDFDWVRMSGSTHNPNTGPESDHTTNTPAGHYYCLPSSAADGAGQTAKMSSPLYPAGETVTLSCNHSVVLLVKVHQFT